MKQEIIGIQIGKEEVKLPTNLRPRIESPEVNTHTYGQPTAKARIYSAEMTVPSAVVVGKLDSCIY